MAEKGTIKGQKKGHTSLKSNIEFDGQISSDYEMQKYTYSHGT